MDYITCQVLDYFVFSRIIQPLCIEIFSAVSDCTGAPREHPFAWSGDGCTCNFL